MNDTSQTSGSVYSERGREFRFNDHVCMEMLMGVPDEKRTGRLVQVRKRCGLFGTDTYFVRLRDGTLLTFENVMMRHVGDRDFEDAFYRFNDRPPPVIPEQPPHDSDAEDVEYTKEGKYPATGFIVESPDDPQTPGAFAMTITSTPNNS